MLHALLTFIVLVGPGCSKTIELGRERIADSETSSGSPASFDPMRCEAPDAEPSGCTDCARDFCCEAYTGCAEDDACTCLTTCLRFEQDTAQCETSCDAATTTPAGVALLACLASACETSCTRG